MIPSLEGWPAKAKEAPSPHEVRLALLNTNPVFQCLGHKALLSCTSLYRPQGIYTFRCVVSRMHQQMHRQVHHQV